LLHGIVSSRSEELPITCADSLAVVPGNKVDVVVTNPPFGVRGSVTYSTGDGRASFADELVVRRPDFWAETANKQLNFLQHVWTLLRPGGRAAVVVPDNVLFESGAASIIRRRIVEQGDVHTILRLPPGLFYAQGVKANVLFFDRLADRVQPRCRLWVYDLRSEIKFSLKARPLRDEDLQEFVSLYSSSARASRQESTDVWRWRSFERSRILADPECSLDLRWSAAPDAGAAGVRRLDQISQSIANDLNRALLHLARASGGDG
jgi:type I restriction enzyme M protein